MAEGSGTERAQATLPEVQAALERLRAVGDALRARSVREVVASLGRVGGRFLDDSDPLRRRALAELPEAAHLSTEMAREVLDGMARDWTTDRLASLVEVELPGGVLDRFGTAAALTESDAAGSENPAATIGSAALREVLAVGPALCAQIVSGTVPGVGVHALLRSLLVKAPTLLKPGRGDVLLPALFAQALEEEDPELAAGLEVLYWPGGLREVEATVLAAADVAVVYGADDTVRALRGLAPATTRLVTYHHRVGVGLVGRGALTGDEVARSAAFDVAKAVAVFEQRGCVCPQLVWVEEGADVGPADFAHMVAESLAGLESSLPSPTATMEDAGLLAQLRGTAELHAAAGALELHHGGAEAPWTVIYEPEPVGGLTVGSRTARIRPLADMGQLGRALAPLGPHLQSVGHVGLGDRLAQIGEAAGRAGASRIVPFSALAFPPPWWLHDGQGPLRGLVRWVEMERE